jgi:hypothetical protein
MDLVGDSIMKDYDDVFEEVRLGMMEMDEFLNWLHKRDDIRYNKGFADGFDKGLTEGYNRGFKESSGWTESV